MGTARKCKAVLMHRLAMALVFAVNVSWNDDPKHKIIWIILCLSFSMICSTIRENNALYYIDVDYKAMITITIIITLLNFFMIMITITIT